MDFTGLETKGSLKITVRDAINNVSGSGKTVLLTWLIAQLKTIGVKIVNEKEISDNKTNVLFVQMPDIAIEALRGMPEPRNAADFLRRIEYATLKREF